MIFSKYSNIYFEYSLPFPLIISIVSSCSASFIIFKYELLFTLFKLFIKVFEFSTSINVSLSPCMQRVLIVEFLFIKFIGLLLSVLLLYTYLFINLLELFDLHLLKFKTPDIDIKPFKRDRFIL